MKSRTLPKTKDPTPAELETELWNYFDTEVKNPKLLRAVSHIIRSGCICRDPTSISISSEKQMDTGLAILYQTFLEDSAVLETLGTELKKASAIFQKMSNTYNKLYRPELMEETFPLSGRPPASKLGRVLEFVSLGFNAMGKIHAVRRPKNESIAHIAEHQRSELKRYALNSINWARLFNSTAAHGVYIQMEDGKHLEGLDDEEKLGMVWDEVERLDALRREET